MVAALGNPLHLVLGPGQPVDCSRADELLAAGSGVGNMLADKGYDADAIAAANAEMSAQIVIPSKKNRKVARVLDRHLYRDRNKIERSVACLRPCPGPALQ